jgi:dihydrofolate reductase
MRKIRYAMSVSLDGFIETASGDLSWSFPDPELHRHFNDQEKTIDTYLYGRRLYENMALFWPTADQNPSAPEFEKEYARIWKAKKKIVFSHSLTRVGWNAQLFTGDIAAEIKRLKAQPGLDMSLGGPDLAATFMRLGLIDEYRLYIHPVVLSGGKPMFPRQQNPFDLKLVESHTFGSGVVLLKYTNQLGFLMQS